MAKATTIKEALAKFEEKEGTKGSEAAKVTIFGQIPPIEKMDASLSTLASCTLETTWGTGIVDFSFSERQLSLSTNMIEKIANLNGLKNLCILSLGRNYIKSLTGLEPVGDTLQELWISYNMIEKLKGINVLKKLKVLYIRNNNIKDNVEFSKLTELKNLTHLGFVGNPLADAMMEQGQDNYTEVITKKLPKLKSLDGFTVIREDDDEEEQQQ